MSTFTPNPYDKWDRREREWSEAESLLLKWVREYFTNRAYPSDAPQWERELDAASLILKTIAVDPNASPLSNFIEEHGTVALLFSLSRALERAAREAKPWTADDERAAMADLERETLREA